MLTESKQQPIKVVEGSELYFAIKKSITLYRQNIAIKKRMIDYDMKSVYGRKIYFKECETSDIELQIKSIIKDTSLSLGAVAHYLNDYLGYKVSFFRSQSNTRQPVELGRIRQAYFAARERKPFWKIEQILYEEEQ